MLQPLRGEVWWADLDPTQGREQAGKRPVVILSVDPFNRSAAELVIVAPMTSRDKGVRSHILVAAKESGLDRDGWVKCEDVRSISTRRLSERAGLVPSHAIAEVGHALRALLGL